MGIVLMLRFGPRNSEMVAEEDDDEDGEDNEDEVADLYTDPEPARDDGLRAALLARAATTQGMGSEMQVVPRSTSSMRRLVKTESRKSTFAYT
jgi:hypothetical protein